MTADLPKITTKELEKLATLARVKLTEDDKVSLVKEFDSILGYIDQLKKVNVSLDSASRIGVVKNVARLDKVDVGPSDALSHADTRERLLNEAPDREGDFVAVKKILG